jgi:EAL domain-containing protein (putative c-di-GMP-specific phosphodiesterase class I)
MSSGGSKRGGKADELPKTSRPGRRGRIGHQVTAPPVSGINLLSNARSAPPEPATGDAFLGSVVPSDSLSVVFQPIVSLDTGAVFACEALVRCSVPAYSNPEKLFADASLAGCTGRLGRMNREVALSVCRDLPVFLNVHPSELNEPWLIRPDDPIYTHATDVYLEITETVPFQHFDLCHSVLREIRWRGGVHLVVDDLGAGYSNLKRISDLEPKVVKLDRELIHGLHEKGIELAEEYTAIRDCGVHYGQRLSVRTSGVSDSAVARS